MQAPYRQAQLAWSAEDWILARRHVLRALLPAALLFGLAARPAGTASTGATETARYLPVWLAPLGGAAAQPGPALFNMPPGWITGDAAIVLAAAGDWPAGRRERLVAALLDAGAAVLELNLPRPGPGAEKAVRAELAQALATLRGTDGAGLVVAMGHGSGGAAAPLAQSAATLRAGRASAYPR